MGLEIVDVAVNDSMRICPNSRTKLTLILEIGRHLPLDHFEVLLDLRLVLGVSVMCLQLILEERIASVRQKQLIQLLTICFLETKLLPTSFSQSLYGLIRLFGTESCLDFRCGGFDVFEVYGWGFFRLDGGTASVEVVEHAQDFVQLFLGCDMAVLGGHWRQINGLFLGHSESLHRRRGPGIRSFAGIAQV